MPADDRDDRLRTSCPSRKERPMNAIEILRNRRAAVTSGVISALDDLADVDLAHPVVPGTSPLGLTLWHIPRAQDWLVHTCIRGVAEVADGFTLGLPDPERYGFGTGLTPHDAQAAASSVVPQHLADYAIAVGEELDGWRAALAESDLDAIPPFASRQQARAAYVTREALADIEGLDGLTVGVLLLRPAMTHAFRHLGELETLGSIARTTAAAR
jgi:hypothetical protein